MKEVAAHKSRKTFCEKLREMKLFPSYYLVFLLAVSGWEGGGMGK